MFSYEDCIRVVRLYIKLGKRTGATIRRHYFSEIGGHAVARIKPRAMS